MSITTEDESDSSHSDSNGISEIIPIIQFSPFAEPFKIKIRHTGPTFVDAKELAKFFSNQDSLVQGWTRFHRVLGTKSSSFFQIQFQMSSGIKSLPDAFEALVLEWIETMGLNATMGILFSQLSIYDFSDVSEYLQSIPEISSSTHVCQKVPEIPEIRRIALDSKY